MRIHTFEFNPLAENTYIIYDESRQCAIVDPGCLGAEEQKELSDFILRERLTPVKFICTHCHFDHVFGAKFVYETYGLRPWIHRLEEPGLKQLVSYASFFRIEAEEAPAPEGYIEPGQPISFANTTLDVLFTPGHSVGSVCFFHRDSKQLLAGDVLFRGSIGRTNLPGGSYETLMRSIYQEILPLGDEVRVFPGHGPDTTIQLEKRYNPFLQPY